MQYVYVCIIIAMIIRKTPDFYWTETFLVYLTKRISGFVGREVFQFKEVIFKKNNTKLQIQN